MCKNAVKILPFVIKYAPDQYKTNEIYDKVIIENCGMLGFISAYYKDQKMCNKAGNNYSHALIIVSNCYKTQKMCSVAVDTYPSAIQSC